MNWSRKSKHLTGYHSTVQQTRRKSKMLKNKLENKIRDLYVNINKEHGSQNTDVNVDVRGIDVMTKLLEI